ncbi:MAG: hypothetical protein JST10_04185 [Bacteroidetes bacterium]|nr:hypothetical protein [Bacteroidota bacterium]MBS1631756.1 hypothetical protein [Bacteroidota bacterium]
MPDFLDKIIAANEKEILVQPSLLNELSSYINELILTDFSKLVQILYRLDIPENKLKQLLADNAGKDAGKIIAEMIIERQIQKINSRQQFHQRDKNISEDEKW